MDGVHAFPASLEWNTILIQANRCKNVRISGRSFVRVIPIECIENRSPQIIVPCLLEELVNTQM